jgi:hypothetical protein
MPARQFTRSRIHGPRFTDDSEEEVLEGVLISKYTHGFDRSLA